MADRRELSEKEEHPPVSKITKKKKKQLIFPILTQQYRCNF